MKNKSILLSVFVLVILGVFSVFIILLKTPPPNEDKQPIQKSEEQLAQEFIVNKCTDGEGNVETTECFIQLSDDTAAEREWKQSKLETMKHPQINTYDLFPPLVDEQTKIRNWRKNFETMRDTQCIAKYAFRDGMAIPLNIAICETKFELEAINILNNLYYETIMKNVYDSQGISDFEPTKADIEKLVKTNATIRGCVWAGEEEPNCKSPVNTR